MRISNCKSNHTLITLNDIAKRHVEWVKISKYVGGKPDEIGDIIQTMYLKLGEIQLKEGSLDRFANYNGKKLAILFRFLQSMCSQFIFEFVKTWLILQQDGRLSRYVKELAY